MIGNDCSGKVAVVVGGTRGIGREAAVQLARAGAEAVAVTGRSAENAQVVADLVAAEGSVGIPIAVDVSDVEATETAMAGVHDQFGRIDVLVANAGINPYYSRAERVTPEIWDEVLDVNLRGIFFAVTSAGRRMLEQQSGSIIIVSSVTSTKGTAKGMPYVAGKGALDAMVRGLAVEWADRNVRVNAIAPGHIVTDLTEGFRNHDGIRTMLEARIPLGRFGRPDEIAYPIVYLASDASSYLTGQIHIVDGGFLYG